MPQSARRSVAYASEGALRGALKLALRTIDLRVGPGRANRAHNFAAALRRGRRRARPCRAAGRAADVTTILLRSIAEIARDEGEDLSAPPAALACAEVFGSAATRMRRRRSRADISPLAPRWPSRSPIARALVASEGIVAHSRAGRRAAHLADCGPLRSSGGREGGRAGGAVGRDRRRRGQCRLRRSFPDARPRSLHRAAARAGAQPTFVAFEYQRLRGERRESRRAAS